MKNLLLFSIMLLSFASCKLFLGMKDPTMVAPVKIEQYNKKYKLDYSYEVNPTQFYNTYKPLFADSNEQLLDNLYQPLQLIVFNKNKENICHLVNCNIGGFPKLQWNRYHSFDSLPVNPMDYRQPEYKVTMEEVFQTLSPTIAPEEMTSILTEYDYVYVVYYGTFMYGYSKPLLKLINKYKKDNKDAKIKYIYAYTDNLSYNLSSGEL